MPELIRLRDLTRSYREGERERAVLRGVDATIAAGEFVALLGRSGSGKSTLLNLVAGIDVPTAGAVEIDGVALHGLSDRERTLFRRRHVGLLFQFFNLISTLTVEENVLLPLELAGRTAPAERARARELVERVGLGDRLATFPDRLSGGEQQRVALVRAIVHRPRVLLADEPTGNLDADAGRAVLALVRELARGEGTTVLMATHSPEAAHAADRVLTLHEGRLVEDELAAEL